MTDEKESCSSLCTQRLQMTAIVQISADACFCSSPWQSVHIIHTRLLTSLKKKGRLLEMHGKASIGNDLKTMFSRMREWLMTDLANRIFKPRTLIHKLNEYWLYLEPNDYKFLCIEQVVASEIRNQSVEVDLCTQKPVNNKSDESSTSTKHVGQR